MLNIADYFESAENRAPFIQAFGSEITNTDGSTFNGVVEREHTQDNDRKSFYTRWQLRAGSDDVTDLQVGHIITYKGDNYRISAGPLPDDTIGWTKFMITKQGS